VLLKITNGKFKHYNPYMVRRVRGKRGQILVKKLFKKIAAGLLTIISTGTLAGGLAACGAKSTETEAPANVDISKVAAPTDGSLPTAHSGAENLAYIAGVLESQSQYHCFTSTVTNASIATQVTSSYKDYKDGVMISTDITYSSMVKSGTQTCFIVGGDERQAYMRYSEAPDANTNQYNASWVEGAPTLYSERAYLYTYGIFQTELSNYIINESTILESSSVQVNSDGTYTQSYVLDPQSSTYYYQYGMKTRGGLGGYPNFQQINLSVTFDSGWRVLGMTFKEVAEVNKGVNVTSISEATATYSYDDASFDSEHFAYYENYFKSYIGSDEVTIGGDVQEELVLDVTSVLSNGFSKIMDGGQQFEVTANVGDKTFKGYIFLALDLADPLNTLEVKLSLGKTLQEQGLFIEYKNGEAQAYYSDDFALKVNLAAVKLAVEDFTSWADKLNSTFAQAKAQAASDTDSSSSDDVLSDLLNAMQLVVEDDGSKATLSLTSDDLLGLGIGIDGKFVFGVSDNEVIFRGAKIGSLAIGGEVIDLSLSLNSTTAKEIERASIGESAADLADYIADVYSLLSSDLIKVQFALNGDGEQVNVSGLKGINANVTAYVDIDGVTCGADISLSYARGTEKLSAEISAYYNYAIGGSGYGEIVLSLTKINGVDTDIKVYCDIAELADGITALLKTAEVNTASLAAQSELSVSAVAIINGVLTSDFSEIVSGLYANSTKISLNVNVDNLLQLFNIDAGVKFGSCRLEYVLGKEGASGSLSAELPAIGFSLNVSGADGEVEKPDLSGALNLSEALNFVDGAYSQIEQITSRGGISFALDNAEVNYDGIAVSVNGYGEIIWAKGEESVALNLTLALKNSYASASYDKVDIKLIYNKNASDAPLVVFAVNGVGMEIYSADVDGLTADIKSLANMLGVQISASNDTVKINTTVSDNDKTTLLGILFGVLSSTDFVETLNKFTLSTDGTSLALKYLSDNTADISVSTDNNLSLSCAFAGSLGFSASAKLAVNKASGSLLKQIQNELDGENYTIASTKDGDSFVRVIYNTLFDVLGGINMQNALGSSTYNLQIALNGDNSNIAALEGINVQGNLYYTNTDGVALSELDLYVQANGFTVKANVVLSGGEIYVSVPNIANMQIPYLKVKTNKDSLYSLVSDLVGTAIEEDYLSRLTTKTTSAQDEQVIEQSTYSITDMIVSLVNFDVDGAFIFTNVSGVKSATLDLDNILSQLNASTDYSLGSVSGSISEGAGHDIALTASVEGESWLSVTSSVCAKRDYSTFDRNSYVDLSNVTAVNIVDICNLINSENFAVKLTLSGGDNVVISQLKNLTLSADVVLNVNGLIVGADLTVGYTYQNERIEVALSAYYTYDEQSYGDIVLTLKSVNGKELTEDGKYNFNVKCNVGELIDGITALLQTAQIKGFENGLQLSVNADLTDMLSGLLQANFAKMLSCVYSNKAGIGVNIDIDELLSAIGVESKYTFGDVQLKYVAGSGNLGGTLSASVASLGLSLRLEGAEEISSSFETNCLDLNELVDFVNEAIENKKFAVTLKLDGDESQIEQLAGLSASLTANVNVDGIAADAMLKVKYTYGEDTISCAVSVYYGDNQVYLNLCEVNGVATSIKVYCNVTELTEAVSELLKAVGVTINTSSELVDEIKALANNFDATTAISGLIKADFSALVPQLVAGSDGLSITVDGDKLLEAIGGELSVNIGKVSLSYVASTQNTQSVVSGKLPALGLDVSVTTATNATFASPDGDFLDLTKLVKTVNSAYDKVQNIIDSQSISFYLAEGETEISVDGIVAGVDGYGEVSWKKDDVKVALDLRAYIKNGGEADAVSIKLIYMDAPEEGQPMVRLALNNVGLNIYEGDIESVKDGFNTILKKLGITIDKETKTSTSSEEATSNDQIISAVLSILAGSDFVDILNNFTLAAGDGTVGLTYLSNAKISVALDEDAFSLIYNIEDGNFATCGNIQLLSEGQNLAQKLTKEFGGESYKFADSTDGSGAFVKLAYDSLFDCLSSISVENILGSKTYNILFTLTGDNSNISALNDVNVTANMYFTGKGENTSKLTEGDIDLDVYGVSIKLNVVIENQTTETYFYINLKQVLNIKMTDLMVMATRSSLYSTLETLFNAITKTDVLSTILNLADVTMPTITRYEDGDTEEEQTAQAMSVIKEVVYSLLTFDYSQAFTCTEKDGVTTASVDLDNLVNQLKLDISTKSGSSLGMVEAVIDHNANSIKTSGKNILTEADGTQRNAEWIALASYVAEKRDYSSFNKTKYVDIRFLPTLLDDVINFATNDNGNMYNKFTLSGTITAKLINAINLKINVTTLSVSFDENNDICISFVGNLEKIWSILDGGTIGVTYYNGYLTLARNLDSSPEYKIMTTAYFIDHMFDTYDESTLNWLLGITEFYWNTVVTNVTSGLNISSGSGNTEDVYLYNYKTTSEVKVISMYEFVDSLCVKLNGETYASFGKNITAFENQLGVSDNYYGFALNAGKITNGTLTTLYAAITRNSNGLSGVKAYGEISTYVNFSVNLTYNEGIDNDYVPSNPLTEGYSAPNLYKIAYKKATDADVNLEEKFKYSESTDEGQVSFGCYSTSDNGIDYATALRSRTVTIYQLDGTTRTETLKHGSTLYLYSNDYPEYADSAKEYRIVYSSDLAGENMLESIVVDSDDIVIYQQKRKSVTISIYNNGEKLKDVKTFVGDSVQQKLDGYDVVQALAYDEDGTSLVASTDKVTEGMNGTKLYGKFVYSETEINGVTYKFDSATNSYTVTGEGASFESVNDGYNYYSEDGWLVLENTILGYPVTTIAKGAFANTSGGSEKTIKNVLIPANITTIGESAFLDNYGIKTVVFLADEVTFLGKGASKDNTSCDSDTKTLPFYGCTTAADGTTTSLTVYYNTINANGKWNHVKYNGWKTSAARYDNTFIGDDGGATYGAGSWSYVEVVIDNQSKLALSTCESLVNSNITSGLVTTVYNTDTVAAAIVNGINAITAEELYIDGTAVEVTSEKDSFGYTVITVKFTDAQRKYLFEVSKTDSSASVVVEDEVVVSEVYTDIANGTFTEFNGKLYTNDPVTLSYENKKYELKYWLVNGNEQSGSGDDKQITLNMSEPVSVKAVFDIINITFNVNSSISFTVASGAYNNGELSLTTTNTTAVADDSAYTFLGWAVSNNDELLFVDLSAKVQELINSGASKDTNTYYAIWGKSEIGSLFTAQVNVSGTTLVAPVGNGVTLDGKWYTDNTFANAVTNISEDSDGILYTRSYLSFTYKITGGTDETLSKETRYFINGTEQGSGKRGESFSGSKYTVLEGSVSVTNDNNTLTIVSEGNTICTIKAVLYYYAGLFSGWKESYVHTLSCETDIAINSELTTLEIKITN
jgi:hypothetical protein